jgi:predicted MFS family arabinose efflux permease
LAFVASSGAAAANLNCLQPILALIATDLHASPATVGVVAVALQVGYALGVLAFVPLGDIVDRRGLILGLFALSALSMAAAAVAPNVAMLALAFGAVGIGSTVSQIVLALVADLAAPGMRGRAIGFIQTGLVYGVVLVRVIGGVLGKVVSWRAVFTVAAIATALSTIALVQTTPRFVPSARLRYRELVTSMPAFVRDFPSLRATMVLGFGAFSLFAGVWTTLAFHMRDLGYGSDVVGYLGAVSIFGGFLAGRVGYLTDRWGTPAVGGTGLAGMVVALAVLFFAGNSLLGLIVGLSIFATGSQSVCLTCMIHVFGIDAAARSRLNTIFNVAMYAGGAFGAFVCVWMFQLAGWSGVCAVYLFHLVAMGATLLWFRLLTLRGGPSTSSG